MTEQFNSKLVTQFLKYDYHDRGMMKWQGFYLSDHTSVRAKEASAADVQLHRTHLAKMSVEQISNVINEAIVKKEVVTVDLAQRNQDGQILAPITGRITGWIANQLIVNQKAIYIEEIYAIKRIK
ncbi:hypothetical protein ACPBEH_00605 [Latilactobacillus sp. 5-91]|uniref:hypothetical protein n=1 Tax=Latilactobacillus sp. 5-91 TaxID=3410924 RepID=UPI003C780D38